MVVGMVQFGPCDYSMSIGLTGQKAHPKVKEAERKTIETALDKGVVPRAEISDVKDAKKYIDLGVRHFSLSTDVVILHNWLKKNGSLLREELSII